MNKGVRGGKLALGLKDIAPTSEDYCVDSEPKSFAASPLPEGAVVVAVRRDPDGSSRQVSGSVLKTAQPDFELGIDPAGWQKGDVAMLVAMHSGSRFRSAGEVITVAPNSVTWQVRSSWLWWGQDRREETRYPCDLPAELFGEGPIGAECEIVDISRGGAAVASGKPVPGLSYRLLTGIDGFSSWFPCDVVTTRQARGRTIAHLHFGALDRKQSLLMGLIISRCEADWAVVERELRAA